MIQHTSPFAVHLAVKGLTVPFEPGDGYIGDLDEGMALITLTCPKERVVRVFTQDQDRNLALVQDLARAETYRGPKNERCFEHRVVLQRIKSERFNDPVVARYPFNNLVLVEKLSRRRVAIGSLALVSQAGKFFLTEDWFAQVECFRDQRDQAVCPRYDQSDAFPWISMARAVESMFSGRENHLRPVDQYERSPLASADDLKPVEGRVIYFKTSSGTGLLVTKDGPARFHWSEVPPQPRFRHLKPGQRVYIRILEEPQDAGSRFRTSHKLEAKGIELIQERA